MARQILVASIGMAPQVVTETLWALLNPDKLIDPQHRTRARFAPGTIHLVGTSRSREVLVARGLEGKLTELLKSHGEPAATLIVDIPRDASSGEIADIRTEAENIAYANHIGRVIQHYAADRDTRLHVSLAGGRKTMTCYDHSAIMMFGREQDELSHVLIEPEVLESCPDFWWPGQRQGLVSDRQGRTHQTGEDAARIDLVSTPFVRLRHLIEDRTVIEAELDYQRVVSELQQALDANRVTLTAEDRTLRVGTFSLPLPHREFALYAVLATAVKAGWRGAGPDGTGPDHAGWLTYEHFRELDGQPLAVFLDFYDRVYRLGIYKKEKFDDFIGRLREEKSFVLQTEFDEKFMQLLSKLKGTLKKLPNTYLKYRINVVTRRDSQGGGRKTRFGLMLAPHEIELA